MTHSKLILALLAGTALGASPALAQDANQTNPTPSATPADAPAPATVP